MVRMSSESGLNVDGAVLSWSIIPSGQHWLKSNRLEMMPIPRQNVFQTYIISPLEYQDHITFMVFENIFLVFSDTFFEFFKFSQT